MGNVERERVYRVRVYRGRECRVVDEGALCSEEEKE